MPLIKRWGLMHCFREENVSEHSHQVAVIAHMLAVIRNTYFDGDLIPEKAATIALYHEISETKLQDLSNTTKYSSPDFTQEYKKLEDLAEKECLNTLPIELRDYFENLVIQNKVDSEYRPIVKAADILSAYIKAKDELRYNNAEFDHVKEKLEERLMVLTATMPEVKYFFDVFCNTCSASLDELAGMRT